MNRYALMVLTVLGLVLGMQRSSSGANAASLLANVPEAANYDLVYQLDIPSGASWGNSPVPYQINNATNFAKAFTRIAYYLELVTGGTTTNWVYVSMDRFTTNITMIGVPNQYSGEFYHYGAGGNGGGPISNANILSNVGTITPGTGINTINLEFWPYNYSAGNGYGVPGANGGTYDFGDTSAGNSTYGSMQIHNYGASQTLFAYNNWNGGGTDIGIGNQPAGNPDWTFAANGGSYTLRTLQILVGPYARTTVTWSNPGVSAVTTNSANAYATLAVAGDSHAVATLFWGTSDPGPTNTGWAGTNFLGTVSTGLVQTAAMTNLLADTPYFFRFYGTNSATTNEGWSTTGTVRTVVSPAVDNSTGATVSVGQATLRGNLTAGNSADIYIYWGRTDGGLTTNYENIVKLPYTLQGAFSTNINVGYGFSNYYYVCWASNAVATAWAPASTSFSMPQPPGGYAYSNGLRGSLFKPTPDNDTALNLGGARYTNSFTRVFTGDKTGTVLALTEMAGYNIVFMGSTQCGDNNDWGPFPTLDYDWEHCASAYSGRFYPEVTGTYRFRFDCDDRAWMWIDMADDGVFDDPTDRVSNWDWRSDGTKNLTQGQGYNFVAMAQEFGGNRTFNWYVTPPGGSEAIVSAGSQAGVGIWRYAYAELPGAPVITNAPVSNLTTNSATLNATLLGSGFSVDVYAYWGRTNGLNVAGNWEANAFVGTFHSFNGTLTLAVTNLALRSQYYYAFFATNSATNIWAQPSGAFQTVGPVTVNNGAATAVTRTNATLGASVDAGGKGNLKVYWGLTDGGTSAGAWQNTNDFGEVLLGSYSTTVTVRAGAPYYYRAYATNAVSEDWADSTATFATPVPAVSLGSQAIGFSPTNISSCVLWLEASATQTMTLAGNTVNEWRDRAGGSTKATLRAGTPTWTAAGIGGKPTVRFNASSWMNDSVNHTTPVTVLAVTRQTGGSNGRVLGAANNWLLGNHGGTRNDFHFDGWVYNSGTGADTTPHLYAATIPGSGQNTTVYGDGVQLASNTGGTTGPNNLQLNGYGNGANELSDCEISEVLIYNRVLSADELKAAGGYLAAKYGVGAPYAYLNETGRQVGVTATLSAPSVSNVTVSFSFAGTAVKGTDYVSSADSVVIPAGSLSSDITLTGVDDALQEEDETIVVAIASLLNATNGVPASVTNWITSDDPLATNGSGATPVTENSATLNGVLTMGDSAMINVFWGDNDGGTNMANWDATNLVGTVNEDTAFATGAAGLLANKAYYYHCYATNASLLGEAWAASSAAFTSGVPSVAINDIAVTEGNSGMRAATFTLTISTLSAVAVSVTATTADGLATVADSDYITTSGIVTIPAGQSNATFTVQILGDTKYEYPYFANEMFYVNLSSPSACTISDAQGVCTIVNDDAAPAPTTVYTWTPTAAGTYNWDNIGPQDNWGTWLGGAFPSNAGDTANMNIGLAGDQEANLNRAVRIGTLNIGDADAGYYGMTISNGTAGSLTFDVASGSALISKAAAANSATDTIAATVTLNDPLVVSNAASGPIRITGAISGNSLTKDGTGPLVLSNSGNALTGISVNGGSLEGSASSIGVDVLLTNSATVTFNQTADGWYGKVLSGSGSLTKSGSGMLSISTRQGYDGDTLVSTGTLQLASSVVLSGFGGNGTGWTLNGSALSVSGNVLTLNPSRASAFRNVKVPVDQPFNVSFQVDYGANTHPADGISFVLQNSTSNVLGSGYFTAGITPSASIVLDTWNNATWYDKNGGTQVDKTNAIAPLTQPIGPTRVDISYDGVNLLTATLTDTNRSLTYTHTYTVGSLTNQTGGTTAYMGFASGGGGAGSTYYVRNFSLIYPTGGAGSDLLPTNTTLRVATGGKLDCAGTTNTVAALYLGGYPQANGTWGASGSGAMHTNTTYFSGSGMLVVQQNLEPIGPPEVSNGAGATTDKGTAILNGNLLAQNGSDATVYTYWGDNDGGTDNASWNYVITNGTPGMIGPFSIAVSNLLYGVQYYYRTYATNSSGDAWAPGTTSFLTSRPVGDGGTLGSKSTALLANVPEAANYDLIYEFPIPVNSPGWNTAGNNPYSINNATNYTKPFNRIAYYLELAGVSTTQWVYVSMDRFTTNVTMIGLPTTLSGEYYRRGSGYTDPITNANIYSSEAAITKGTGINTINLEFWPSNYGQNNDYGVPGANSSVFDFGDGGSGTGAGHGSMQIHNHGAGQTLFGYSAWGGARKSELGIGNQVGGSGNPDWTFNTDNISTFTNRILQILAGAFARSALSLTNAAASDMTTTSAVLHATLACTGAVFDVTAFWNTTNGGTNAALWTNSAPVGSWTNVASTNIRCTVTGLAASTDYYFTFRATNAAETMWATNVLSLTTRGPLAARFSATPTICNPSTTVMFTDTSISGPTGTITNRYWDFGDGTTTNTTAASLPHIYTVLGLKTVQLIVSDSAGGVSTNTKVGYIDVRASQSAFTWTPTAAGTYNWDNAGPQDNWGTWSGGAFPNATGATANLNIDIAGDQIVNLNQAVTIGALNLGDTASGYFSRTIHGGSLVFDVASGNAQINKANPADNATDTISATVTLNDPLLVNNQAAGALLISGAVGGNSLAKTGAGTLILSSASNSLTGIAVSGGTLQGDAASIVTNVVLSNNANVTLNQAAAGVFGQRISGTGSLTKIGAGALTLTAAQNYSGATILRGGMLQLRWSGGTNGVRIMPAGDSITEGAGATAQSGYRGPLYNLLTAGGVQFQFVGSHNTNPGYLPTTPVDQTYHNGYGGWTVAQILSNIAGWLGVNPDIITLMIGTNNTGNDIPTVIGQLGQIIETVHTNKPNTLLMVAQIIPKNGQDAWVSQYNASMATLVNGKIAAGYNLLLVDLNTGYPAGTLPDGVHPNDTGYNWMAQQWNSAILASSGGGSDLLPITTALTISSNATLNLNGGSQQIASLSDDSGRGGSVTNSNIAAASTLTLNPGAGSTTFSGRISDGGGQGTISLVKIGSGAQVLSGNNTYSGGTTVSNGTLLINNVTGTGTGMNAVTVKSGATLGGTGTVGGATTVEGGGYLAPGASIGTFTLSGDADLQAGSTLKIDLSGTSSDVLVVGGDLNLAGTLTFVTNVAPALGSYVIVTNSGTRVGTFTSVANMPAGYEIVYNPHSVVLRIAGTLPPPPVLSGNAITISGGVPTFHFETLTGFKYGLDYRDTLTNGSWQPVIDEPEFPPPDGWRTNSTGATMTMTITDTNAAGQPQRFYRLKAANP